MNATTTAVFNVNDHAIVDGWATYHADSPCHDHIHAPVPEPTNGHAPSNYARCGCGASFKWFVVGQHRYGSLHTETSGEPR